MAAIAGKYAGVDWSAWRDFIGPGEKTVFGDSVQLKDVSIVREHDSLHLLMAFEALDVLSRRFRISVHQFVGGEMSNFDFDPVVHTDSWGRYETVICHTTIPKPASAARFYIGVFDSRGSLSESARVEFTPMP